MLNVWIESWIENSLVKIRQRTYGKEGAEKLPNWTEPQKIIKGAIQFALDLNFAFPKTKKKKK